MPELINRLSILLILPTLVQLLISFASVGFVIKWAILANQDNQLLLPVTIAMVCIKNSFLALCLFCVNIESHCVFRVFEFDRLQVLHCCKLRRKPKDHECYIRFYGSSSFMSDSWPLSLPSIMLQMLATQHSCWAGASMKCWFNSSSTQMSRLRRSVRE